MTETSETAKSMCQSELTAADIKAICRARGFSGKEAGSVGVFENFLVSDIGVSDALERLNRKEILILHLLRYLSKPVGIDVFEPIAEGTLIKYGTFTEKYKGLFKQIRERLIQKGILFFSENPFSYRLKTKLEKYLFVFPKEFHPFMPSPFQSDLTASEPGEESSSVIRETLLGLVREPGLKTGGRFRKICDRPG
jgi:hypothetical protein